jgi:hypothetical protein
MCGMLAGKSPAIGVSLIVFIIYIRVAKYTLCDVWSIPAFGTADAWLLTYAGLILCLLPVYFVITLPGLAPVYDVGC